MAKILCIIDGMSDPSFVVEDYQVLSSFPKREYVNTVPDGFEAETLPCVLSLLGISSPQRNIRGWIEALGARIQFSTRDLIFRTSWVELDSNGVCVGFCDAPERVPDLNEAQYHPLDDYRGLLVVPGYASFVNSAQTIPPFEMLGKNIADFICPDIPVLKSALSRMRGVDSNCVMLPWAASVVQTLPCFPKKAAVVCGTNVVKGIAKALCMRLITSTDMTGDTDTDLNLKVSVTLDLARDYPFVILHIGGCDEAAHRMDRHEKEAFLKKIDTIVLPKLLASDHIIEVVSDHGTDPATGRHVDGLQQLFRRPK